MVLPTTVSRWRARSLRVSGGSVWLSARSMSSRSGAVYCRPVSPVRGSVVSAAVRPHSRPTWPAIVATTSSSNRPRVSVGRRRHRDCRAGGNAADSPITAGSGRGTASPERMVVASAVSMACASSGCGLHFSGGSRIWVRGSVLGLQRPPQHGGERVLAAGDGGVVVERHGQRRSRRRSAGPGRCRPRPARRRRPGRTAPPPPGATTVAVSGRRSSARRSRSPGRCMLAAAIATVEPCAVEQVDARGRSAGRRRGRWRRGWRRCPGSGRGCRRRWWSPRRRARRRRPAEARPRSACA